ncbi:MAG: hypothetical protein E6Q48_05475 [Limnohabitans sp.]|nr:MAG: hypothetical protein E6Q48_05475 [Limnohabitans sp.]
MGGFFFFLFWTLCAFGVAYLAAGRGRSGLGFFLLSFFMSPILGLIVVLVMRNLAEEQRKEAQIRREHEAHLESIRAIASKPETVVVTPPKQQPSASVADEIKKLAELKEAGLLTEEEFAVQKSKLLT